MTARELRQKLEMFCDETEVCIFPNDYIAGWEKVKQIYHYEAVESTAKERAGMDGDFVEPERHPSRKVVNICVLG